MRDLFVGAAERICDWATNLVSYPPAEGIAPPCLIAHRGAWDSSCLENSLPAFHKAQQLGAGGIEFDVHFTRDGVPVVVHDPDLWRTHRTRLIVADCHSRDLDGLAPAVPRLEEVLNLKSLHFMIEIKTAMAPAQVDALAGLLETRVPGKDFHLLTLNAELVRKHRALPGEAWILVGDLFPDPLISACEKMGLGGVACHYLFMNKARIARLKRLGCKTGAGFIPGKNIFNREWNLGVDYVFTNHLFQVVSP